MLLAGLVFPLPPALLLVVQLSQAWLTWTPLYCSTQVGEGVGWGLGVVRVVCTGCLLTVLMAWRHSCCADCHVLTWMGLGLAGWKSSWSPP